MKTIDGVYALLEAADPVSNVETLDSSAVVARVEAALGDRSEAEDQLTESPARRVKPDEISLRRRRPTLRPAWAAAVAFAVTVVVLGGSLAIGAAMHHPAYDSAAQWMPNALAVRSASIWWLLIPSIAIAIGVVVALVVRNRQLIEKEKVMTTTLDTGPAERLETAERNNRWLVAAVVVLALAVLALGAWVVYDLASQPETAATDEIKSLYDDYVTAVESGDRDAFFAVTAEDYAFRSQGSARNRTTQFAAFRATSDFQVERIGDLVVMGEGPIYYVASPERITYGGTDYVGISALRIEETDRGMMITDHVWLGSL